MSTITSYDEALDFMPAAERKPGPKFLAILRLVAAALREGLDASHGYQELTARGVPHAEAARQVFADHYEAR